VPNAYHENIIIIPYTLCSNLYLINNIHRSLTWLIIIITIIIRSVD
jgi:hypothetical protein